MYTLYCDIQFRSFPPKGHALHLSASDACAAGMCWRCSPCWELQVHRDDVLLSKTWYTLKACNCTGIAILNSSNGNLPRRPVST
jgi:hypothetical protein